MKHKFFCVLVMAIISCTPKAQIVDTIFLGLNRTFPWLYEHSNPVDTVRYGYPMYMFNEPHNLDYCDSPYYEDPDPYFAGRLSFGLLVEYGGSEQNPEVLYGIATTALRPYPGFFSGPLPHFVVASRNSAGEFIIIDSLSFDSYRVDKIIDYYLQANDNYEAAHFYFYLHEYFFDHPVPLPEISGPFYVGSIMDSNVIFSYTDDYSDRLVLTAACVESCPEFFWVKDFSQNEEWRKKYRGWGAFFPIIRPDSLLCGRVENFRLEERGDDYAVVAWHPSRPSSDLYSGRFQVAVGGLGPRPDTTNILTFNDSVATLTGLDSGVWYSAWVRGECCHCGCPMHGDTLIWSSWRGPLQFYLGDTQPGTQGIATVDGEEVLFSLSPNPANETVTVAWHETQEVRSVELVDMAGQIMLTQSIPLPDTRSIMLDTSPLPSGVYLIRLYTPKNIVARKLTVLQQ